MPIPDFKELSADRQGSPSGEGLEGLVRELGKRLGLDPQWSGRGADQGRDLIFTERRKGPIATRGVRWLVSCKDFSGSGRSVGEQDLGAVMEKTTQGPEPPRAAEMGGKRALLMADQSTVLGVQILWCGNHA